MPPLSSFYQTLDVRPRGHKALRSKDDIYLVLYDGIYDECVHTAVSEPCVYHTFHEDNDVTAAAAASLSDDHTYYNYSPDHRKAAGRYYSNRNPY